MVREAAAVPDAGRVLLPAALAAATDLPDAPARRTR